MTARIVAVTNQKGGSGKTTTSMTLGASLGIRGLKVLIVDADPQSSATRWYSHAPEDQPYPATVINLAEARDKVSNTIKAHLENYDLIIIDCPPHIDSPVTLAVMLIADLAIAPVIPSAIDTWATEKLLGVANMAREHNDGLIMRAMLNQVRTTALARAISADLAADPTFELMPVHLSLRTTYGEAAALGLSVYARTDARAIEEANALGEEVLRLLGLAAPLPAPTPVAKQPAKAATRKAPSSKATQKTNQKTTTKKKPAAKAAAKVAASSKKARPAASKKMATTTQKKKG
jgi:chromosome partitioning protein